MEANELMIGNLVTIENKKSWLQLSDIPLVVCGITENSEPIKAVLFPESKHCVRVCDNDRNEYNQLEEFIKPIPLTEEWLLKFGFEKDEECKSWSILTSLEKFDYLFEIENKYQECFQPDFIKIDIKYVHQLQNLYFALTGNKLEIK